MASTSLLLRLRNIAPAGSVFIIFKNGLGATIAVAFSLGARRGAPVAKPLRGDELERINSGDAYDI